MGTGKPQKIFSQIFLATKQVDNILIYKNQALQYYTFNIMYIKQRDLITMDKKPTKSTKIYLK